MARTITVAAAQTGPVLTDDLSAQVAPACEMIDQAARQGADVICFPEVFMTPFFPNRLIDDFDKYFLTLPDPLTDPIFERAARHSMAMVFPYAERCGSHYYNAAAITDRSGKLLGTYRKTHIPAILPSKARGGTGSYEKFYFTPGDALPVFDLDGIRIGVQICYDRKFPEGCRALAIAGAEIVFIPICAATYGEQKLRAETWELPIQARAYENGVFVVAPNRAGDEHGRLHMGKSMIVNPVGAETMALGGSEEPEVLVATLDLDDVRVAQKSLPWWRDRRPELYATLAGT
ncbi:MAG: carbon-nitrogen hydrolase family protein [Ectothiorhodospiraceae bacterium]|nr:carbon-nitrogen hydrolase family protein [Chromatiales bacterium]MCP5155510.1 carbon-nitrogen hydrolase family protein [Ectothiorhodospiraceae bacterium]